MPQFPCAVQIFDGSAPPGTRHHLICKVGWMSQVLQWLTCTMTHGKSSGESVVSLSHDILLNASASVLSTITRWLDNIRFTYGNNIPVMPS